jgi:aminoglycoside phosphotransferase (APT) family kinase protein
MLKAVERTGDPAIPTLATVLDPAELTKQLSLLPLPWPWDASQEIRLRVLRWKKASRCTFEIVMKTPDGWQELIGKVYAEDRSDVYRVMEEIRRAGFGSEAEFAIPRPVAFLAPLRLLLYEKVPGTRAREFILSPNEADRSLASERCARWLARFQAALAPRWGRVVHLSDHLSSLEGYWRCVAGLGGQFTDMASRLFERLNATARSLSSIEMCAGHGTYTPGQVLLVGQRTVTFDWDTYNMADPSQDVARFRVELMRLGLKKFDSTHALDRPADVFLKTYIAAGRSVVATHLAFHTAAICLDRAKHDVDKQARGWPERVEAMLNEGLRVLG